MVRAAVGGTLAWVVLLTLDASAEEGGGMVGVAAGRGVCERGGSLVICGSFSRNTGLRRSILTETVLLF